MKYYLILAVALGTIVGSCSNTSKKNPMNIDIEELVGISTPFEKWAEWGTPETLEGTDNRYWAIYLDKANITLITRKSEQRVVWAGIGKEGYKKALNKLP